MIISNILTDFFGLSAYWICFRSMLFVVLTHRQIRGHAGLILTQFVLFMILSDILIDSFILRRLDDLHWFLVCSHHCRGLRIDSLANLSEELMVHWQCFHMHFHLCVCVCGWLLNWQDAPMKHKL
jgi:hypothetical protein